MNAWILAAVSLPAFCLIFGAGRGFARRIDNYGIIDIIWCYSFALLAAATLALERGWFRRREAIAGMFLFWSLRLGTHVLVRVSRLHPKEDARYRRLRQEWGRSFERKMTGFFQLQAGTIVLLGLPLFLASRNPAVGWSPWELAGAFVWLAGWGGETVSDRQLAAFKASPANRDKVCAAGLWRYSRHPNYFFEWVEWMGYFLFACGSPWGWTAVICPGCILYFLLSVTGIPMAEEQSLRSKGEAYRRYQARTSAFVPWPPRRAP